MRWGRGEVFDPGANPVTNIGRCAEPHRVILFRFESFMHRSQIYPYSHELSAIYMQRTKVWFRPHHHDDTFHQRATEQVVGPTTPCHLGCVPRAKLNPVDFRVKEVMCDGQVSQNSHFRVGLIAHLCSIHFR